MTATEASGLRGLDLYVAQGAPIDRVLAEIAALSGIGSNWIFDGNDILRWASAVETSAAGWVAWYETGIPSFPLKLDVNLLSGADPFQIAQALSKRLNRGIAVPDDNSPNPDRFVLLTPDGARGETLMPLS